MKTGFSEARAKWRLGLMVVWGIVLAEVSKLLAISAILLGGSLPMTKLNDDTL
jgi:hypothetical protein